MDRRFIGNCNCSKFTICLYYLKFMTKKTTFFAIGLMSGSSLDGLDICYVRFLAENGQPDRLPININYNIIHAECIEFSPEFRNRLKDAEHLSAFEFAQLHMEVGLYFGQLTHAFIQKNNIEIPDFICSHGHTIFHQPTSGFTTQIGCGAQIAAQTGCKVVCDLRTTDVAYHGQGAPIVPVAEQYLFPDREIFLNIGGIANIAFHQEEKVIAYDICAANTLLNHLAKEQGKAFDESGRMARSGNIIPELLNQLNNIGFCKQPAPKSLGSEHIYKDWIPLADAYKDTTADKLATAVEHIAMMAAAAVRQHCQDINASLLISGGGAFNTFLAERIGFHSGIHVEIPDTLTIQYKEALAMALIGLLRILEIPNCMSSVTGAQKNVTGGAIYLP